MYSGLLLLIELSHADIKTLNTDQQTIAPLLLAQSIFDSNLKNQTRIIVINADETFSGDHFFLLNRLLGQLRDEIKD